MVLGWPFHNHSPGTGGGGGAGGLEGHRDRHEGLGTQSQETGNKTQSLHGCDGDGRGVGDGACPGKSLYNKQGQTSEVARVMGRAQQQGLRIQSLVAPFNPHPGLP